MRKAYQNLRHICAVLALGVILAGCAANYPLPVRGDENIFRRSVQADIFPGGVSSYSFGPFQKTENFVNVDQAQVNDSPRNAAKSWWKLRPSPSAIGMLGNMQSYFRFDVRWKLKDGREFILENIDVRSISNDYLRKNPIQLQWQRENRQRAVYGDFSPTLSFEVKDDVLLLKWVITITKTPLDRRLTASGAANRPDTYEEEHLMATLKGKPTSGIDFSKTYEPRQ